MAPGDALKDMRNRAFAHTERDRQAVLSHSGFGAKAADFPNIVVTQPCAPVGHSLVGTPYLRCAPLARHIGHVFGVGSQKKMFGPTAWGVIAPVKHQESRRYGTVRHPPSETMRQVLFDPIVTGAIHAVSATTGKTDIPPTFASRIDTRPESRDLLWGKLHVHASLLTACATGPGAYQASRSYRNYTIFIGAVCPF